MWRSAKFGTVEKREFRFCEVYMLPAVMAILTVLALVFAGLQWKAAETANARVNDIERQETEWQRRQEAIANSLARIGPNCTIQKPGTSSMTSLYPLIFQDPHLRLSIQTYIVELDQSRSTFIVRKPAPHELRSDNFRRTVTEAERLMKEFAEAHTDLYTKFFK
jgi:hypothetical protein